MKNIYLLSVLWEKYFIMAELSGKNKIVTLPIGFMESGGIAEQIFMQLVFMALTTFYWEKMGENQSEDK